jgi:hypothetical protein
MQTFLPYPNFKRSLQILDYRRLGKQRVEALTLIHIIEGMTKNGDKPKGWVNHPITIMWNPFPEALKLYYNLSVQEWVSRGYKNNLHLFPISESSINYPDWFGYEPFHASHRSNLLRKDLLYYSKYGWNDNPDNPYLWRDRDEKWYTYDSERKNRIYIKI